MNRRDALMSLLTLPAVGSVSVAQVRPEAPKETGVWTYAGDGKWIKLPDGMNLTILRGTGAGPT